MDCTRSNLTLILQDTIWCLIQMEITSPFCSPIQNDKKNLWKVTNILFKINIGSFILENNKMYDL